MSNRLFGNQNSGNQMPAFEQYKEFSDKVKEVIKIQRMNKFFFWFGVCAFWVAFCIGSAFAIQYLVSSLSFIPSSIQISVLDVLKVYGIMILLFWVKRLFPAE